MKFEKLQPGVTVYDVGRTKMGNTTRTTVSVWPVHVISVDYENRTVVASWNTNPPRTYSERNAVKWRKEKPMLIGTLMGGRRLATREERKAAQYQPRS